MNQNKQLTLQKKHQLSRGKAEGAAIGILMSSVAAPFTHGISLFSLLFNVPRVVYYGSKQLKYTIQLRRNGTSTLRRRKRDFAIPVISGSVGIVIGSGIPGLEHVQHGAEHLADQVSPTDPHQNALTLLGTGIQDSLREHYTAVVHPGSVFHDGAQNLLMQGNLVDSPSAPIDGLMSGIHDLHQSTGQNPLDLVGQHVYDAFDRMDELIKETINGTFTANEMQAIGKNLTSAIIGEILGKILEAPMEAVADGDEELMLQMQFHDIILSYVEEIEKQKELVRASRINGGTGIGDLFESHLGGSASSSMVHLGMEYQVCQAEDIVGIRYTCRLADEDIHYCASCYLNP